ncbi:MAG: hypothetical protein J5880_00130, partial [Bacilli bacterium]|nr:hypothetical protein [Bacilli bacterium]
TGEKNHNWTGTLATGSVEYNVNWTNVLKNYPEAARAIAEPIVKAAYAVVEAEVLAGTRKVFDTSKFTVSKEAYKDNANITIDDNGHVTRYLADTDGDFAGDTNVIMVGTGTAPSYFDESTECSAPYFDLRIEGINLLNEKF